MNFFALGYSKMILREFLQKLASKKRGDLM